MMTAICIDRKAVCVEHDHNGMTLEYFHQFIENEFIPAYKNELTDNMILQIQKAIAEKSTHIFVKNESGKMVHSLVFTKPFISYSKHPEYEYNGI